MFDKVKKRDGRIVPFDKEKIAQAIFNAAQSVGGTNLELSRKLADLVESNLSKQLGNKIPDVEQIQDAVEKILIEQGHAATAKAYILYRQKRTEIREAKSLLTGVEDDIKLTLNALKVLERRYLLKDSTGKVLESPSELFQRVASNIAQTEYNYGGEEDVKEWSHKFYELMRSLLFLPNSPTLMNAGTSLQQLSACFVLPVPDSMEEIFNAVKYTALIHKSGGGTGFSFSNIRPSDDIVQSTGGVASGPISFMRVFDVATDVIKQGGRRRGANMGILRYDHPDIFDFITAKDRSNAFSNFNISVGIDEKFMKAVEKNENIQLKNPRNGKVVRTVRARAIFDLLVYNAWKTGDPGIVFLDRLNKDNPTPHIGRIESTNPCFHPDTLISTENGLISIEDLYKKYKSKPFKVLTDNRTFKNKITRNKREYYQNGVELREATVFPTGRKKTMKLYLHNGQEIKVTPDHLFLTTKGWKKAENLNKNDYVLIQSAEGNWSENDGIGSDLGLLLGWITGDGWLTKAKDVVGMVFAKNELYILGTMQKIAEKYGGGERNPNHRKNGTWQLLYKRKKLLKLLMGLGLQAKRAHKKRVPESLFTATKKTVSNFLSGLFSSDGTVNYIDEAHRDIRLSSTSIKLLKDVQLLLLNMGIFSRIYDRTKDEQVKFEYTNLDGEKRIYESKPYYELIITGNDIVRFSHTIKLIHEEKQKKLDSISRISRKETKYYVKVDKIEEAETVVVYDITENKTHSLIAQGIVVHNCGEQPLLPYEACNLGSINLSKMVTDGEIDYDKFKDVIHKSIRFLDNVIDMSKFPIEEITEMVRGNRKIGLGVMGFADMLIQLGIPYNSEKAMSIADEVMKFLSIESKKASQKLAGERGPFPNFEGSKFEKNGEPPIRNSTRLTIAPTGTISIIAGCSSGIEPLFAVVYIRNVMEGTELMETNKHFEITSKERSFYSDGLMRKVAFTGSVQDINEIPEDVRKIYVTAHDVDPKWHVKMQAAFQKWVDNAVSKTVNLSYYATPQDVEEIYMLGYKLGVKGITIYRDGSKGEQVLYMGSEKSKPEERTERPGIKSPKVDLSEGMLKVDSDYSGGCETCEF